MSDNKTVRIRELNDHFRSTLTGGRVVVTSGIDALDEDVKQDILNAVQIALLMKKLLLNRVQKNQ